MWDKGYGIALILFGFNFVAQILLGIIAELLGVKTTGMGLVTHFVAAYTIGQVYTSKRQRVLPQSLRIGATIYYTAIATGIAIIGLFILTAIAPRLWFAPLLGLITPIVVFPSIYWGLSSGSKAYLKKLNK